MGGDARVVFGALQAVEEEAVKGFPSTVRALVAGRSQGLCEVCVLTPATEMHHRRARGMGGDKGQVTNSAANCLHLCSGCHRMIEANPARAYESGWKVKQWEDPREVPVEVKHHWGRVLLDERGGWVEVEDDVLF